MKQIAVWSLVTSLRMKLTLSPLTLGLGRMSGLVPSRSSRDTVTKFALSATTTRP